jgi:uncharacterized protein YbjT (DUF2867 family)
MRILVTGATGFVGSRLVPALVGVGHGVTALVRDAGGDDPPVDSRVVEGDLLEPSSYAAARDVDAAYYLVRSMTACDDFANRDRRAADGVARPLIAGLKNPVVVYDDRIRDLVPVDLTTFDEAIRRALAREGPRADAATA